MHFDEKILKFYRGLTIADPLPPRVEVMNPYASKEAMRLCREFYGRFYRDDIRRYLIVGINPGRYGAGLTGIPFTDPVKLEQRFGIANSFPKKTELSADFIYAMIDAFGGAEKFYGKFFINSISPLGFVMDGKNLNYYDTPDLRNSLGPFIQKSLRQLARFNIHKEVVFCLGEGANFKYLETLNAGLKLFDRIIPLAHPRFIMQYRRKQLESYINDYLRKLQGVK